MRIVLVLSYFYLSNGVESDVMHLLEYFLNTSIHAFTQVQNMHAFATSAFLNRLKGCGSVQRRAPTHDAGNVAPPPGAVSLLHLHCPTGIFVQEKR